MEMWAEGAGTGRRPEIDRVIGLHRPTNRPVVQSFPRWRCFNPRPREGGDEDCANDASGENVSTRAPAKGATGRAGLRRSVLDVSIRAPAKGATSATHGVFAISSSRSRRCFNPRPREGGDEALTLPQSRGLVSIRAPAKGATRRLERVADACGVSIRAPAKGATQLEHDGPSMTWFQSAPPRRGRRREAREVVAHLLVSIRAPATTRRLRASPFQRFNPRPREGGDLGAPTPNSPGFCFNPRPREGGDIHGRTLRTTIRCFNPRPREGGDAPTAVARAARTMFQSAPPRRGRLPLDALALHVLIVSIRAPAKGATGAGLSDTARGALVSIRAPAKGATSCRPR